MLKQFFSQQTAEYFVAGGALVGAFNGLDKDRNIVETTVRGAGIGFASWILAVPVGLGCLLMVVVSKPNR